MRISFKIAGYWVNIVNLQRYAIKMDCFAEFQNILIFCNIQRILTKTGCKSFCTTLYIFVNFEKNRYISKIQFIERQIAKRFNFTIKIMNFIDFWRCVVFFTLLRIYRDFDKWVNYPPPENANFPLNGPCGEWGIFSG